MAEENLVTETSVKYDGIFDFKQLYSLMTDLAISMGYTIEEKKYKQKESPEGNEVEVEWWCTKDVDDYTRFKIILRILILGMREVQAKKGELKVRVNEGSIQVLIKGIIVTDYANRWETHPILKLFKGIYDRYFFKSTFERYKKRVYEEAYGFENEIKSFLNLRRFM